MVEINGFMVRVILPFQHAVGDFTRYAMRTRRHDVGNAYALAALFPAAFQLMRRNGTTHRKSALNPDIRFPSFCVIFCKTITETGFSSMMCKGVIRCKQITETGFIFVNRVKFVAPQWPEKKDPSTENRLANVCRTVRIAPIFLTSYAIAWGLEP